MMCRPMRPILLMYGFHDMRHTGFSQVDGSQREPRELRRHSTLGTFHSLLDPYDFKTHDGANNDLTY